MSKANDSDRYVVPNDERGGWDVKKRTRSARARTPTARLMPWIVRGRSRQRRRRRDPHPQQGRQVHRLRHGPRAQAHRVQGEGSEVSPQARGILDMAELEFKCPKCRRKVKTTVGAGRRNRSIRCPSGHTIEVEGSGSIEGRAKSSDPSTNSLEACASSPSSC